MIRTIILALCMLPLVLVAQEEAVLDSAALDQQIREFAPLVNDRSAEIDQATEIDSIHALANELEERSDHLLNEVRRTYPIDDALLLERNLINASQLDLEPDLAADHLRRSHAAQEQIDASMPDYYSALRRINELAKRIGSARKATRAQQLNEELKEIELFGLEPTDPEE